jgi:hypothetical protein
VRVNKVVERKKNGAHWASIHTFMILRDSTPSLIYVSTCNGSVLIPQVVDTLTKGSLKMSSIHSTVLGLCALTFSTSTSSQWPYIYISFASSVLGPGVTGGTTVCVFYGRYSVILD